MLSKIVDLNVDQNVVFCFAWIMYKHLCNFEIHCGRLSTKTPTDNRLFF